MTDRSLSTMSMPLTAKCAMVMRLQSRVQYGDGRMRRWRRKWEHSKLAGGKVREAL